MMISGIYAILNIYSENIYVGSAVNFTNRWYKHLWGLVNNQHQNNLLQRAWNKRWNNPFIFIVLEYCEKEKLIDREQYWIDFLKPMYNICLNARSTLGLRFKHKVKRIGKPHSEERKLKLSLKGKLFKHKKETKIRISNLKIGHFVSKETREKISKSLKKWPHEKGCKCKCNECKLKRNKNVREWRKVRVAQWQEAQHLKC